MLQTTLTLLLFLFPLAYSPGPGNMIFAANGARFGFRSTIQANAGYHIATWIITAAIGFGFMTTLNAIPNIIQIVKAAGSVYILWVAWNLFSASQMKANKTAQPLSFAGGIVLLVLNPKAYVIIALMFSQFLGQPQQRTLPDVVLITTVFTLNNLLAFSLWAGVGNTLAKRFRTPQSAQFLNRLFGAILALVAIWMFIS